MTTARCLLAAAFFAMTSMMVGCAGGSDYPSDLGTDEDFTEAEGRDKTALLDPVRLPDSRDARLEAVGRVTADDPAIGKMAAEVPRLPRPGAGTLATDVPR